MRQDAWFHGGKKGSILNGLHEEAEKSILIEIAVGC
jgi:hypothetical protein